MEIKSSYTINDKERKKNNPKPTKPQKSDILEYKVWNILPFQEVTK